MKYLMLLPFIALSQLVLSQAGSSRSSFWSEDFANGLNGNNGDGAWITAGPDSAVWKHSFYGSSGLFSAGIPQPNTSTAASGFMLFDGDSANVPNSPNFLNLSGSLISPRIDLSAQNSIVITFEHWFRYCCSKSNNFELMLGLSNDDGATWYEIPVDDNLSSSVPVPNPTLVSINVSPYVANEDSVRLRFRWGGVAHYFWVIDDIKLQEAPPYDLELIDFVWETDYACHDSLSPIGIPYTSVNSNDSYSFQFSGAMTNTGANPTNAWLTLEVYDNSSLIQTINGDTVMIYPNDTIRDSINYQIPSINNQFEFRLSVEHDSIYLDTSNNNYDSVIIYTTQDHGYQTWKAKDDFQPSSGGLWNGDDGAGTTYGYELVTAYKFNSPTFINHVWVELSPNSDMGTLIYPVVYEADSVGNLNMVYSGMDQVVNSSMQNDMLISNGINVLFDTSKTYYFGVGHYGGPGAIVVAKSKRHLSKPNQTMIYDAWNAGTWISVDATPKIRIYSYISNVSTKASNYSLKLHPNPSSDYITLTWNSAFEPNSYHIHSSDGKLVRSNSIDSVNELRLNCTGLQNGLYTITFTGDYGISSQQFIITK